jgi:deazaflavin-dependent oxidoreductase (nitroreductase family)
MSTDLDTQVIDEFRAHHGQVSGRFVNVRLMLLTTVAGSGASRTTPLRYFPDGRRTLLVAVNDETTDLPPWYHDIVAQPQVTVERGPFILQETATVLHGEEREQIFARLVEAYADLAEQQAQATRSLPVIALENVSGVPSERMLGKAIRATHDAYRRELALVRAEIAASGSSLGTQLRMNCLMVCQGIHQHHIGEDTKIFPSVRHDHPELAPLLERLSQDHKTVQHLLDRIQEVVAGSQSDITEVLSEVDRLIAELEDHLTYEETNLLPVLDSIVL